MSFDSRDEDILDADVLRRILKFANQTTGDLSHAAQDIDELKKKSEETEKELEEIKESLEDIIPEESASVKRRLENLTTEVKYIRTLILVGLVIFTVQFILFFCGILIAWLKLSSSLSH